MTKTRKCSAQAHLAPVTSLDDVKRAMAALLTNTKLQRATHNIMAFRIHIPEKDTFLQVGLHSVCTFNTEICSSGLGCIQHSEKPNCLDAGL